MPQVLVELTSDEYEHPFDRNALNAVEAIPVLPDALNVFMNYAKVRWDIIDLCGSCFQVTSLSCADLNNLVENTSRTLYLQSTPPMYIQSHYDINAYTVGHQQDAYMVFNSGTIDKLSDEELIFVIGHEMGHVKSGHVLYHGVATYLSSLASQIPIVGGVAAAALKIPIERWRRMAEFTADRAGLLACQDIDVAVRAIMKMSGLPERFYDNASIEGFKAQANQFKQQHGNGLMANLMNIGASHPWMMLRLLELIDWYDSNDYQNILNSHRGKKCPICGEIVSLNTVVCPVCGYRGNGWIFL